MINRKRKELYPVTVIENNLIKEDVHYLKLDKKFSFKPGQVLAIALKQNDEPRLYSIASGIDKDYLGILFDVNPDGQLTPTMSQLKSGDQLYISEPFGKFLCEGTPAMWIATGTGIAPFVSLAESNKANNITLIHGARTIDAFYLQDTFIKILGENYNRFCTSEQQEGIYHGRLTTYLQQQKQLPTDYKYYLCGNSQMIIDVREILIEKGVPFDHIIAEIYF
ncbi:FAD-binding oxidoreductase [Carboxylicivirga caseinilyticus]|uniref:FAD-binding oxidoreductase n=1 Tax=Carboxylicivirga caseinilyticus TaxID=3417572 RepID=UPI003D343257|nr:oxidoreductase [Marinilabiliaceae bacterium A049]